MRSPNLLRLALLSCVPGIVTCGAEGTGAPYVIAPDEDDGGCPTTEEALAGTRRALKDGRLDALTPIATGILVDDGGVRVMLPALRLLSEELPTEQMLEVTEGYEEGRGLARMIPHLVNVLEYVEGSSPYLEGEHYPPVDALHRILTQCDAVETLGALRRLLELEVTLDDGTTVPWLDVTFDALVLVANDPAFTELLGDIELSDDGGQGGIVVGRDAFKLVARLISGNVASPDFDLAYTRALLNDLLVSQLPEGTATRENLNRLLDLLEMAIDPGADIFPHMQSLMACVNRVDNEGEIPGMLYDYLSIDELDFTIFLDDLDLMGADPAGTALRLAIVDGARALEQAPRLGRDMLGVMARFVDPEISRVALPAVLDLRGAGVLTELIAFLRAVVIGCSDEGA